MILFYPILVIVFTFVSVYDFTHSNEVAGWSLLIMAYLSNIQFRLEILGKVIDDA